MKDLCLRVNAARLLLQLGEAEQGLLIVAGTEGECRGHQRASVLQSCCGKHHHATRTMWTAGNLSQQGANPLICLSSHEKFMVVILIIINNKNKIGPCFTIISWIVPIR